MKRNGQEPSRIFNINDPGVNCFRLDHHSGKLIVIKRINREDLCDIEKLKKYGNNQCEIIIKLAYETLNVLEKLTIIIEDVNDNPPIWNVKYLIVSFNENEQIGTRRSLPEATDIDSGQNSQINYRLESKYRNYFRISQDNGLYLENTQLFDREKQDMYELTLVASDNGIPLQSNQLKITVEIIDINDNNPQFTERVFRPNKLVPENIAVGTLILTLKAKDLDIGENGKFTFRMNKNTVSNVKKNFLVQPNGDIIVKSKINYDIGHSHFEFKVIVEDKAVSPYSRSSEAIVEIDIQDVNDEFPEVLFYALRPKLKTGQPSIDENQPVMTVIGQLSVKDVDFKGLDKVICETGFSEYNKPSPILVMNTNEMNEFQVVSNRKFDREIESELYGQILCSDTANHVTKLNITIIINDLNDNAPLFNKNTFHLYINENQPIGTAVSNRLYVTDLDIGENKLFTLSIESPEDKMFYIDQKEQLLKSSIIFDREMISEYKLKVFAIDNGIQRLTSSCVVFVHIRDLNDNPVILSSTIFTFHILENNKPRTSIGNIKVSDLDNQTIFYTIDFSSQVKFDIEKYSGNLIAQKSLDREDQDIYHVIVVGSDGYYTVTATVTIFIDDINDNSPVFVNPNNSNKIMKIDIKETPGYRVGSIIATDRDSAENGMIRYTLKRKTIKQLLFNLDGETGDLYLTTSLHNFRLLDSSIYLDIEACDLGVPKLCTILSNLEIKWNSQKQFQINQENISSKGFSIEYFLHENVLILAISGLLAFMIIIMVVFVLIRQKSDIFIRRRNITNLHTTNKSLNKTLICYPDNFGPPDYKCSTELENLDTDIIGSTEVRTTPMLQCSNLYLNDTKSKSDLNPFRYETVCNTITPKLDLGINSKEIKKCNPENYYSKYLTDRYCKIVNTECPILNMESNNSNKIRHPKNHSSFV